MWKLSTTSRRPWVVTLCAKIKHEIPYINCARDVCGSAFSYLQVFLSFFFFFFNRSCWLFSSQQCASVAIIQSTVYIGGFCILFMKLTNFTIFIKNRSYGTIHTFKNYFVIVFLVLVILTNALRTLVKNSVKESFYGKKKKSN